MRILAFLGVLCLTIAPAMADWNVGDPYKMHYPQLPDPTGWDVYNMYGKILADDWLCTETGPVLDFHFWGSWQQDYVGVITDIDMSIHSNDTSGPYSKPGELLWYRSIVPGQFTMRPYGTGDQGWYNPNTGWYVEHDHQQYFQINIEDIVNPFIQQVGTIYWVDVSIHTTGAVWGWKTSLQHFEDDAVWGDAYDNPIQWNELRDPITQQSLDLAFVITPEPAAVSLVGVALLLLRRR